MSLLLSFGMSFILMFLLPGFLGTHVFNGMPLGDVFLDVAYWPFLISDTLFGIENLDLANAVGVGFGLLSCSIFSFLLFYIFTKKNVKTRRRNLFRCFLLSCFVFGVAVIVSVFTSPAKCSDPDIRAFVLDKIQPGMKLAEVRPFIPRELYADRFRPTPISGLVESRENNFMLNPHVLFLSDATVNVRYQLDLFAGGRDIGYEAVIYFDQDLHVCGVYYPVVHSMRSPFNEAHYSSWVPQWEHVRYSELLQKKSTKSGNQSL